MTALQAVYVPADDFTDPSAVHTFSHLSASIVLSRNRASEGLYPAIDELLGKLNTAFQRVPQSRIDEALFDVVAGCEALAGEG